jgi:hypothetical protein
MAKDSEDNQPSESKINQNLLIAILGALTTIVAAFIPWALSKYESQPLPTSTPLIFTATITEGESKALATLTPAVEPTIPPSPTLTPTADEKTGVFDVYLAYDERGDFRSTSFMPTQNIYLFFNLNDPLNRNIVKIVWIAVDVAGYQPNIILDRSENKITTPSFTMRTNRETWEIGKYKIELYLNGSLDETIEFEVAN